jgi:hypothetical protein
VPSVGEIQQFLEEIETSRGMKNIYAPMPLEYTKNVNF